MSSIDVGWLRPIKVRALINEFISVESVAFWMAVSSGGTDNGELI